MITMEQLENLEGRIVKALELISDLRIENSQLDSKVDNLESNNEQLKIKTDEKIKQAEHLEIQLQEATGELGQLKSKEKALETKILQIIAKLDNIKTVNFSSIDDEHGHSAGEQLSEETSTPEEIPLPDQEVEASGYSEESILNSDENQEIFIQDEPIDFGSEVTNENIEDEESKDDVVILEEDEDTTLILEDEEDLTSSVNEFEEEQIHTDSNTNNDLENSVTDEEDINDNILEVFDENDEDDFLIVEENDDIEKI